MEKIAHNLPDTYLQPPDGLSAEQALSAASLVHALRQELHEGPISGEVVEHALVVGRIIGDRQLEAVA